MCVFLCFNIFGIFLWCAFKNISKLSLVSIEPMFKFCKPLISDNFEGIKNLCLSFFMFELFENSRLAYQKSKVSFKCQIRRL